MSTHTHTDFCCLTQYVTAVFQLLCTPTVQERENEYEGVPRTHQIRFPDVPYGLLQDDE